MTTDREHAFTLALSASSSEVFPRYTVNLGYSWTGEPLTDSQIERAVTAAAVLYAATDILATARGEAVGHLFISEAPSVAAYALHYSGIESLYIPSTTIARGWRVYPDTGECIPVRVIQCSAYLQNGREWADFKVDVPSCKTFSLRDAIDATALAFTACTPASADVSGNLEGSDPYIAVRPNVRMVDQYPGYYRSFYVGLPTQLYESGRVEVNLERGGIAQATYEDGRTKSMFW